MALAQFAPSLIKYFTGSDKASAVAQQVIGIAQTVTGQPTPAAALGAIQADPALAVQFQTAVMANESDLDRMYLADVQSARARDVSLIQAGHINVRANVLASGAVALVLITLCIVVWATDMDDFAKATITLICGRALGWVEQVFSFEFGTTRANKVKDDTINTLTK